ncbi:MAG: M24 family metallopeptidase [Actinomycetota bacterium]
MDHAHRRSRLHDRLEELGHDAVLVTRQVNVRYLTGFTGSNGQLLAVPGGGVFLTDSRYEEQSRREVPDLRRVTYPRKLAGALAEAAAAEGVRRVGFEAAGMTYRSWRELADLDKFDLEPLEEEVERLRWAKDPEEVGLLERAQEVTDAAFDRVIGKLAEGVTERQVAFELDLAMREIGAERVGFDSIVAFGENAAEPHHGPSERPLRRGDVVKMDFGCVVNGYHSDMTRTVAFGEPEARLREIHALVLRAQLAGIDAVRSGIIGQEADRAARSVIEDAGMGDRFGHSLGHGVGLEIHEGPTLRSGSDDVLPEGAVVTVEPGVYVPGLGGVRIEDAVVVGTDGCRPLPRTPKDLLVL